MTNLTTKLKIAALSTMILVPSYCTLHSYFGKETIRTKIVDAQMAKVDGQFMIATEAGPFKNIDAHYRFKFNSGTVQNNAAKYKGQEVDLAVYGWRIPLFSSYENVRSIKPVNTNNVGVKK